jgi:hypothetical protein
MYNFLNHMFSKISFQNSCYLIKITSLINFLKMSNLKFIRYFLTSI